MYLQINKHSVYASNGGVETIPGQRTIVFIHGAGMDHTIWVLFNRFFARNGFNTFAIDLPGHGKSAGEPLTRVEDMAEFLLAFGEEAKLESMSLVGHSLGSLVAIEAAARLDSKLENLVLLGSSCPMPVGEALLSAAQAGSQDAVDMIMLYGHAYCSQLGGNPLAGMHIVNNSKRLLERSLARNLFADLNACNNYQSGLDAAARIQARTALVLGEEDKMTPPAAARALIDALPDAREFLLKNCGHMMLAEQPEQVHRALLSSLAGSCHG